MHQQYTLYTGNGTEESFTSPAVETEAVEAGDIETRDIATRDSETRDIATRNTETSEAGESEVSDAREVVTPFAFTTEQLEVIRAIEGP